MVRCILAASGRSRVAGSLNHASSLDPDPVPLKLPRRSGFTFQSLSPAIPSRFVARERRWKTVWSESRTDPLEVRFSPDFRAAVSLGLIKLAPKLGGGKQSNPEPVQSYSRRGGQGC